MTGVLEHSLSTRGAPDCSQTHTQSFDVYFVQTGIVELQPYKRDVFAQLVALPLVRRRVNFFLENVRVLKR